MSCGSKTKWGMNLAGGHQEGLEIMRGWLSKVEEVLEKQRSRGSGSRGTETQHKQGQEERFLLG